jgi:hypothetical protein
MLFGRHNRAINTDVSRRAPGRATARILLACSMSVAVLTGGLNAYAIPTLTLRSTSVTVFADGINPTPVTVLAEVVNLGAPLSVNSQTSEFAVTASGTLNPAGLNFTSITLSNPGVWTVGSPEATVNTQTEFGVTANTTPTNTISTGTSNVASLTFTVPAGITAGTYSIAFLTATAGSEDEPVRSFVLSTGTSTQYNVYANGNDGSSFGLITVVPEPSTGTALGGATVLMAGVGIVQRRMRRRRRSAETVG